VHLIISPFGAKEYAFANRRRIRLWFKVRRLNLVVLEIRILTAINWFELGFKGDYVGLVYFFGRARVACLLQDLTVTLSLLHIVLVECLTRFQRPVCV